MNEAGNNEPTEDDRGETNDEVFLSPIVGTSAESDSTESRRKVSSNSRPTTPLLSRAAPQVPPAPMDLPNPSDQVVGETKSNETLLELSRQISESTGNMEVARAARWVKARGFLSSIFFFFE